MKIFVGTDLIEIERIKKSCQSRRFCERVYSEKELTLFSQKKNPYESMAANWAAKESFAKALGTGVEGFALNEVSCLRDELGCPYLELTGTVGTWGPLESEAMMHEHGADWTNPCKNLTNTDQYCEL